MKFTLLKTLFGFTDTQEGSFITEWDLARDMIAFDVLIYLEEDYYGERIYLKNSQGQITYLDLSEE